jgi:DNA invertase Pin-like site-specific DNA recombinase
LSKPCPFVLNIYPDSAEIKKILTALAIAISLPSASAENEGLTHPARRVKIRFNPLSRGCGTTMKNRKIGYARVSMTSQDLALQLDALRVAGVPEADIYVEKITGKLSKAKRPQLDSCLRSLKNGDCLVVWKLDRLGRSLLDLLQIMQELEERHIRFNSLTEAIDTSIPTGRLMFHLLAAFGEFERNLIRERSAAGLEAARKRGVVGGRRRKLDDKQQSSLVRLYKSGTPIKRLQEDFGVSKRCVYDYLHYHNIKLRKEAK